MRAIKAECGITFAQSEATARFGGMPRSAVATGAIDYVLTPAKIAEELGSIARHPFLIPSQPGDPRSERLPEGDGELRRMFALLYGATKVDFSRYKVTTVRRRMGRRMIMLRVESLAEYARYVEKNASELRELYQDLLISVTSFFRDPESFGALSDALLKELASREESGRPVRVWVPGCATGEEVYSLAICLYEAIQSKELSIPIQIFGTDISELALDRARRGDYSAGIEEYVRPERLQRFFVKIDGGYQINKFVREVCIFARHDVTKDPPFSNIDLVSCRNLLIYLDQTAQRHVLPVFHYALKPTGLLMLGSAETTSAAEDLFEVVDQRHRIYSRKAARPRLPLDMTLSGQSLERNGMAALGSGPLELQKRLDRVIQSKYSPDGVLIDAEFQVVHFRGHTSAYLDVSPSQVSLNVLRMVAEGLVLPLRRAVRRATENNGPVKETGVEIETSGQRQRITLEVTPIPGQDASELFFLVVFVRETATSDLLLDGPSSVALSEDEQVAKLQRELQEAQEYLRNLRERYEAHGEELQAANEEARSTNEELQSTNEELRTTKEELQSANEELTTVNDELQSRNFELNATNSDLHNLLSAITLPILMVDSDFRVRRFNMAAGKVFELGPVDIGRPVGHIRGRIETPRLEQQVKSVIETLTASSEELQDSAGHWFVLNIRPYRTVDDRIAGAVITLQDIDPLKRGLQAAEQARDYAEGMIETVREPLVVLDADARIQRATQAFYDTFLASRDETEGRFLYDLGNGQWNHGRLRELIGAALFRSEPFHDFEMVHEFPHIGRRTMRLNGRRIPFPNSKERMLLLSIEDVTERQQMAELRFQRLFETARDGIVVVDVETKTVQDVNPFFLELTRYRREDFVGRSVVAGGKKVGISEIGSEIETARNSELVRYEDLRLLTQDGRTVTVDVIGNAYHVGSQLVVQFNIRDVSVRKQATDALRESEQRFRFFVESVQDYAMFQMDLTGTILSWNSGAEHLLGWEEQEATGKNTRMLFTPEDVATGQAERELETARLEGRAEDERWHQRKDGSRFFASGVLTQVLDEAGKLLGFAKVMRDVTARKEQEEQLRKTISEKETLVREIHHRVKNNLQVVVSLLGMQSRHTNDVHVLTAFQDAESRLRAIAHIHERLYASDDLTEVEFGGYVTGLVKELVQLHSSGPEKIRLKIDVADMVVHIEQAIPLGLVANELILNSLKHGLRDREGQLRVELIYLPGEGGAESSETLDTGWGQLRVGDTGPGLPPGLDVNQTKSMGLRLVNMLVRQLRGRLEVGDGPGAHLSVSFPLEPGRWK